MILGVLILQCCLHTIRSAVANCEREDSPAADGTPRCEWCSGSYARAMGGTQCCPNTCSSCNPTGSCFTCLDGYFLLNSNCEYCGDGCKSCTSKPVCAICQGSYFKAADGSCQRCPDGCSKCTSLSACSECYSSGYFLSGSQCKKCIENCDTCTDGTVCQVCKQFYFKKSDILCQSCSTDCRVCTSETVCTQCANDTSLEKKDDGSVLCGKAYLLAVIYIILIAIGAFLALKALAITIYCCVKKGKCCCRKANANLGSPSQNQPLAPAQFQVPMQRGVVYYMAPANIAYGAPMQSTGVPMQVINAKATLQT